MIPRNRGNRRGFLGILISERLNSGERIVEIQSDDPEKDQKLLHKVFQRMGEKIRISKNDDFLIFKKK